ncbi:hypothetical protein [Sporolactobacillus vineae]|nr:hypothetical protein [Sporolactobacillus vineae]
MAAKRVFSLIGMRRKQTAASRVENAERINRLQDEMITRRMRYGKYF